MTIPLPHLLAAASAAAFFNLPAALAAEFGVTTEPDGDIAITIDGELFTRYVVSDPSGHKPYFYPVIGPTGAAMTRAFPMEDVQGEKQDHPHHRSMWFGHQEMGGWNTWHEVATKKLTNTPEHRREAKVGITNTAEVLESTGGEDGARLVVRSTYTDPDGNVFCEDTRAFDFSVTDSGDRVIDTVFTFSSEDGIVFNDMKDAGFNVRVAHSMCADEGGAIINSEGDRDKDSWGKRAAWCDFYGPVEGETAGVAILNHPSSFRHPTPWHARTYGLFTANPFGLKTVAGEDEPGTFTLAADETLVLAHRVIFHAGDAEEAKIAEAYEDYAAEALAE